MSESDISAWFKEDPHSGQYLINAKGALLLLLETHTQQPNKKARVMLNSVLAIAKQNGYQCEQRLRESIATRDVDVSALAAHVRMLSQYIGNQTVINLLEGVQQ
ncbi:hypothetical protein ACJJIE_03670 [Microbulbifer sp. TRSA001]|uniref:hypothetical protein n=1 Tax=Microbulbifer sp. TRSA001 TaxID=3243381 RepID=UPI0040392CDA